MAKKKEREYYGGRIKGLAETVAKLMLTDPAVAADARDGDYSTLHARVAGVLEGYGKRDACFNCRRSMEIDIYTADYSDARLLLLMAEAVRDRVLKGMPFTEANLVRVQDLHTTLSIKYRTTQCRYLGLIHQPKEVRNKGKWLITQWGWKVLRGDQVPRTARYWDGKFLDRGTELTTLAEMFRTRPDPQNYAPGDWTDFGGYIQEELPLKT